ncbi:uncharacterized [Tachysurus ichikawai]
MLSFGFLLTGEEVEVVACVIRIKHNFSSIFQLLSLSCPAPGAQLGVIYPLRSCDEYSSAPISFVPGVKKAALPGTDSSSPCAHHTGEEPRQLAPRLRAEAAKLLRPWPRFATCQREAKCCRMIKQEPWTGARFIGRRNER